MIDTKIVIRRSAGDMKPMVTEKMYYKTFSSEDGLYKFADRFCRLYGIGFGRIIENDYNMTIYPAQRDFDKKQGFKIIQK
jgi:hypothetical protein